MLLRFGQPAPQLEQAAPAAMALARQVQALQAENAQLRSQLATLQEQTGQLIEGNAALIAKIQSIKEKMLDRMQAGSSASDAVRTITPDEVAAGPVVEMEAEEELDDTPRDPSGKKAWWRDEKVAGWTDADIEEDAG